MQILSVQPATVSHTNISIKDGLWCRVTYAPRLWDCFGTKVSVDIKVFSDAGTLKHTKDYGFLNWSSGGVKIKNVFIFWPDPETKQVPELAVGDTVTLRCGGFEFTYKVVQIVTKIV